MTRLGVFTLAGFAAVLPAFAQTPPDPGTQPSTLTANSNLVVIPALVRDKAGRLVYSLHAEDFTLTDDGVPQQLHLEEDTGGEPLALVVVIEADAATRAAGWHPFVRGRAPDRFVGVPAMVEAIVGAVPHRIAVVGFDSKPELELPFTSDLNEVADTIQQLDQGNTGDRGAGILDSLVFAVDQLRLAPPGYRRAILLLSETNDRGSKSTLEEALRAITATNTTIYSVAFSTPFHEASEYGSKQLPTKSVPFEEIARRQKAEAAMQPIPVTSEEKVFSRILQHALFGITLENPNPGPPGGCMSTNPATPAVPFQGRLSQSYDCMAQLAPPLGLVRMAVIAATDGMRRNIPESVSRLTGGEYFHFNGAKSLEQDLATLGNHVPNRYILSFQPQSPHAGLHVLSLQVKEYPQLEVTARSGYWADGSPQNPSPNK